MDGFYTSATDEAATIANDVPYAQWLNNGTRSMAPRIMIPTAGDRLPNEWYPDLEEIAVSFLRRHTGPG